MSLDIAELLKVHPRPWHVGDCHESRAMIGDADGKHVCSIAGHSLLHPHPDELAELFVSLVNGLPQCATAMRVHLVKAYLALHALLYEAMAAGKSETEEAEIIREAMDPLWLALTEEETAQVRVEIAKR